MLTAVLSVIGVLSFLYFGIIVLYSGIETSMAWFWPVLGICCFLLAKGSRYYQHHKKQVPLRLAVTIATLCITGLVVFVILQVLIFGGMIRTDPEHLDYLIVLGAKVREDDISASLKRRLDKAIRYAQEHPEMMLVLSGGRGADEPTTEAMAMAEYLRYNGVAPEQMLLENYSTNTRENMLCSKTLIEYQREKEKEEKRKAERQKRVRRMRLGHFILELEGHAHVLREASQTVDFRGPKVPVRHIQLPAEETPAMLIQEILPDKPLDIGVLTSNFHLFRAMKIGEKCGFKALHGVSASADPVLFIHMCVRESIAILKDKFMGNM